MPTSLQGPARVALGSLAGTAIAAVIAPMTKRFFSPPDVGVGWVTVNAYPKGWDYAVIALLVIGAFAGGAIAARLSPLSPLGGERARVRGGSRDAIS
jgi:hypothetical protein